MQFCEKLFCYGTLYWPRKHRPVIQKLNFTLLHKWVLDTLSQELLKFTL